mgnify:CR=1 FL=1
MYLLISYNKLFLNMINPWFKLNFMKRDTCFFKIITIVQDYHHFLLKGQLINFSWRRILFMPPYDEERAYCFAHVSQSICPSVTFSFPINNWRTPWSTLLKLCPHFRPGQQRNPIDFGALGQRSRSLGQMCQNCFRLFK